MEESKTNAASRELGNRKSLHSLGGRILSPGCFRTPTVGHTKDRTNEGGREPLVFGKV